MRNPYKRVTRNGRRVDEHRLVMEEHLGRRLGRFEFVHHKNGNKRDNYLTNLELVSPSEHALLHLQKHPHIKLCCFCRKEFTPAPTRRGRTKTCSPQCARFWVSLRNRKPYGKRSIYRVTATPSERKKRIVPQCAATFIQAYQEVTNG